MKTDTYFMESERLGFRKWIQDDIAQAGKLWGNPEVTALICASGVFTEEEIAARLDTELKNNELYAVQYWPFYEKGTDAFVGVCGLRPRSTGVYELGFHLLPQYWGKGIAAEAAERVMKYAFEVLNADQLFAGHNPKNKRSAKVLKKLGFLYLCDEYYAPTGLNHPSYSFRKQDWIIRNRAV